MPVACDSLVVRKLFWSCAMAALLASVPTGATYASDNRRPFVVLGFGASSCGKYLTETGRDETRREAYMSWLTGYVTAFNEFNPTDEGHATKGTDIDGIFAWISNYCGEHPTESFVSAAGDAILFLLKKEDSTRLEAALTVFGENRDAANKELENAQGIAVPNRPPAFMKDAKPADAGNNEVVDVRYRGPVKLVSFDCQEVTRSSFVHRVCYDARESYMLVKLGEIYYQYCEIDAGTVVGLLRANSMGSFYNDRIKGRGGFGPFDCRTHRVPAYE
jgi:hypothetical protein